ncbi:MAG: lycopene cyclase family protein [Pseudonocardia sp.]
MVDVLVVGGGPAGRALAAAVAARGLRATLVDPRPDRPWRAIYGTWAADLPADLPAQAVAARARGRAITATTHVLGWDYAVLDVAAFRAHLDAGMAAGGVELVAGRVTGATDDTVTLDDGTVLRAAVVVDAGGRWRPLAGLTGRPGRLPAEQTAFGLVLAEDVAAALVAPGEALFMDWRPDHGEGGWPTFLYGIPVGDGRVLLEETSLARRPGLPLPVLRRRLLARLARHDIHPSEHAAADRVHFPLDQPPHPGTAFGAAAPLVHPATGFSIADALRLAPSVADALAAHLPAAPDAARAAVRHVVWPPVARAVHRLRTIGLESMLRMPPQEVAGFFAVFFELPEHHRWAYLTGRTDLAGHAAAMAALYTRSGWRLRARLVGPALLPALGRNAEDPA